MENPYPVQIALAVGGQGQVSVMYGGIPYEAHWKGNSVSVTHLMDIMSHPSCRKSGLFVKTGHAFFDLFAGPEKTIFYYGFPGKFHFEIGEKYLQYTALQGGASFLTVQPARLASNMRRFGGRIEQVTRIDHRFDALWHECCAYYPFSVIRNTAFLEWRFIRHPLHQYELWVYKPYFRPGMRAYAVLLIEETKTRVVDILAPPSERVVTDFLGRLALRLNDRGIKEMETWLPENHFMTQFALSSGFSRFEEPLGFIPTGRSFHPDLSVDWAAKHLYYTMADGDLL